MNAPIIIIPVEWANESPLYCQTNSKNSIRAKDSQALVLDAGHIAVESNLVDKAKLKEIQGKRGQQYNDDDLRHLEDLMYDTLSLRLESTQVGVNSQAAFRVPMACRSNPHAVADFTH